MKTIQSFKLEKIQVLIKLFIITTYAKLYAICIYMHAYGKHEF